MKIPDFPTFQLDATSREVKLEFGKLGRLQLVILFYYNKLFNKLLGKLVIFSFLSFSF